MFIFFLKFSKPLAIDSLQFDIIMSWGFAALVQVSISSDIGFDLENPELNASDWVKVGETVVDIGYGISCNSEFDLQTVSVISH